MALEGQAGVVDRDLVGLKTLYRDEVTLGGGLKPVERDRQLRLLSHR